MCYCFYVAKPAVLRGRASCIFLIVIIENDRRQASHRIIGAFNPTPATLNSAVLAWWSFTISLASIGAILVI